MINKELEIEACKPFLLKYIPMIDEACDKLKLSQETEKLAKDIAFEFVEKTRHAPQYPSFKHLI
jgi:hypothetical protein